MANSLDEYLNNDATDENGFPLYRAERVDGVTRIRPTQERRGNALGQVTQVASDPPITDLGAALAKLGEMIKAGVQYDQRFTGDVVNVARNVLVNPTPEFKVNREALWKALTGKGQERKQLWPEVMVRSGLTLPGDVMSGVEPIIDPATGHTAQRVIERAQDTSGLMAGGTMFGAPRGSATMASGPNPRIQPVTERLTAPKELVKQFENVSGVTITPEGVELNVVRGQRKNDAGREAPWGTFYLPEGHADISKVLSGGYKVGGRNKVSGKLILKNPLVIKGDPGNLANAVAKQLIGKNSEGVMLSPWADSVQLAGKLLNNSRQYTDADRVSLVKEFLTKYAPSLSDKAKDVLKTTKGLGSKPDVIYMDERLPFILTDMAAAHVAKQAGYDGVITHNGGKVQEILDLRKDKRPDHGHHELLSDSGTPGAPVSALASQSKPAPVFYSALEHAVTNAAQDAMTGPQWAGFLKNRPGVKGEELGWTGIEDWLASQKGKVSREDVQRYLDDHKVEIKEVTKKGQSRHEDDANDGALEHAESEWNRLPDEIRAAYGNDVDSWLSSPHGEEAYARGLDQAGAGPGATKYSDYQLPGGENYREHLLTLPKSEAGLTAKPDGSKGAWNVYDRNGNKIAENLNPSMSEKEAISFSTRHNNNQYKSPHWDEPNVLAHVRTNERMMPGEAIKPLTDEQALAKAIDWVNEGNPASQKWAQTPPERQQAWVEQMKRVNDRQEPKPVRSFHIEEIQSDWHQAGRKQGYKNASPAEIAKARDKMNDARVAMQSRLQEMGLTGDEIQTALARAREEKIPSWLLGDPKHEHLATNFIDAQRDFHDINKTSGVPDAPFKTTWPELALKRMIRQAAEEGFDRVSWTPGEAQAARYDLSKHLNKLDVVPNPDRGVGAKTWWPTDKNNRNVGAIFTDKDGTITQAAREYGDVIGKNISDVIGKEIAEKGLATNKEINLTGLDLKIGGEGMKGFYDNMLPKMVEKLGKQHGVKVKKANLKDGEFELLNGKPNPKFVDQPVYYFDIPPAWKDQAMSKGFPLFVGGIPFPVVPVDYNPFKNKDAL